MSNLQRSTPAMAIPVLPLDLTVPARSDEVAGIRRAITTLARAADVGEDRVADIALAVGEACANAVVHAYPPQEPGELHVTAEFVPEGLLVVVTDAGQGMSPRGDSPGLGLGLPLMASLTRSIEVRAHPDGGTQIEMVFAVDGPAASGPWPA